MATVEPPSLEILVREPDGFVIWNGPPFGNGQPSVKLDKVQCSSGKFSEDGLKLMVMKSDSQISIYDCKSWREIRSLHVPHVLAATMSPCGTYIQTFQKPTAPQDKNVVLWKAETGDAIHHLSQKNMTRATWPSIRFSSDEAIACRLATNEVQFFDPGDFTKGVVHRLRVPGVAAVELSKTPGAYVATFVPESKGMPASVQIFATGKDLQSPIARRSFFRCSTVQLNWNSGSTGLLILVQSDVDKTNQSYYGESKLNYLTTDGTHEGLVPLRKEGPVHDVQWSCSGKEFAVVYGFMPAMATVFDKKCNPLLELGTGPFNTIRWNPKGKFLCLAGFGNLPGDMAFWDYVEKRQLGSTKAECSVTSEWSPDGRYFMTATTAPRLQVDNGIKIFHHNGSLYFKKMFDKLYQADWKPKSPDKFGEIAELVKSVDSLKIETTKTQGQGSKSSQVSSKPTLANPPTQKPAAYRPPHAKAAAAVQAQLFGGSPSGELSKNALKNKKKREKQREKKAAEETRIKLAAAIESDKQQLQWFCDACKGIPQVVHPAFPFNNQVHVAPATAPPTSEDMELAMAIDASLQSSLQQRPPHLGTHPGSGADASTSRTNSECGTVHCGSSNLGPDSPQKGSNSGYNGQETSTNGVFQHSHIQTDSVVQSTPQNSVPASIPSAPPVADSVVDDGPIHYPSIDASPLEFSSPPLEIVDASPEERKESSTSSSCVICLDAPVEGACIPCGHMAGCISCLSEIKAKKWGCPVCRAKIDQVVRLYAV